VIQKAEEAEEVSGSKQAAKPSRSSHPPGYKLNRTSTQDEIVQLMKLLSEVIRISNDHQQHL